MTARVTLAETPLAPVAITGMVAPNDPVMIDGANVGAKLRQMREQRGMSHAAMNSAIEARTRQGFEPLKNELAEFGYTPKEKIITHRDNVAYVKCVDKNGDTCFVEIDDNRAMMGVNPNDLAAFEAGESSVIPMKEKKGNLDCVGTDVVGVALVCDDSVCVLTRADGGEPVERNFIYAQSRPERAMMFPGSPMAHPVVRLSEIRANPALITKCINEAAKRILRAATEEAKVQIQQSREAICALAALFQEIEELFVKYIAVVQQDCLKLEGFNNYYMENPPCADKDITNFIEIQKRLYKYKNLICDLLRATTALNNERANIVQVHCDSKRILSFMVKSYNETRGEKCP